MSQVTIYTLSDPITKEVRYVGKTQRPVKDRKSEHIYFAKKLNRTHSHRWINSLLNQGQRPVFEILDICDSKDWKTIEQYWISQLKNWGFNLTNHSIGGEGAFGRKWSKEERENRVEPTNKRKVYIADSEGNPIKWFNSREEGVNYTKAYNVSDSGELLVDGVERPIMAEHSDGTGKLFKSITEAAKHYNLHVSNIGKVLRGRRNTTGNIKFYYI